MQSQAELRRCFRRAVDSGRAALPSVTLLETHLLIMCKKSQPAVECDTGSLPDPEGLRPNQKSDMSHTEQGNAAFGQVKKVPIILPSLMVKMGCS